MPELIARIADKYEVTNRLGSVIVGASSKARKGISGKPVKRLFRSGPVQDFSDYSFTPAQSTAGPFSSGEGLIHLIRNEIKKYNEKSGEWIVVDPGIIDKRLFILDEEFAGVMAQAKREGNTLWEMLLIGISREG
jgi:hypothetical protein